MLFQFERLGEFYEDDITIKIFSFFWLLSASMAKVKLAMSHKECRKTELMYFVFQSFSLSFLLRRCLQAALPNRLR